ncbi:uncharacterized protein C8Q71DRAFT_799483 [Rhodofomes roseus]|uniref:Uncharacterized protein n=1 Tax=Rhodofomes roseus TaxID=34475 RepID=A0ABQ8K0Z6_9APHY|nr:uncharacterized protein C8Q71DRAFT_799483 [Rhodofomes roseus]KAH9830098.1 hypothetical protein C8Q71DRAFT_799483 [Rhodofomes roseus]
MAGSPSSRADASSTPPAKDGADKQSGYSPIFGLSDGKKDPMPRWLPISLLALTTTALVVPIVLLRRQRAANALQKSVGGAPPPPRKNGAGGPPPTPRRSVSTSSAAPPPRVPSSRQTPPPRVPPKTSTRPIDRSVAPPIGPSPSSVPTAADDDFNGALYSAKAFGIATLFVGAGAVITVWGVQQLLGFQNTQEFAHRMRFFIMHRMPFLSSRIHRPPNPENSGDGSEVPRLRVDQGSGTIEWTWPDAERRLKTAYEEGGFMGWAEAALQEIEAEGELERSKRGQT